MITQCGILNPVCVCVCVWCVQHAHVCALSMIYNASLSPFLDIKTEEPPLRVHHVEHSQECCIYAMYTVSFCRR